MRFHRRGRPYWLRHDPDKAAALFRPEHLAFARLEPAISNRHEAILELVFEREGVFAVLGLVIVDGALIIGRESSPFAWPNAIAGVVDPGALLRLEETLEPWLRTRLLARFENDEIVRFYKDDARVREAYERARSLDLFGAAPFAAVLRSLSPHAYATRFAIGRRVLVSSRDGANGAAMLYGRAARVDRDTTADENAEFTARWFGTQCIGAPDFAAHYDVAVVGEASIAAADVELRLRGSSPSERRVEFCEPLPLTMFVSFDRDDSEAIGDFSVVVNRPTAQPEPSVLVEPSSVGGSGGRIALLVREDWSRADDADSDAIRALDRRLRAEGFTVRIVEGWAHLESDEVDLVHVVGIAHAKTIRPKIERFHSAGIPIVTQPFVDDPRGEAPWGAPLTQYAFRNSLEDTTLDQYLAALAARRLNADGAPLYQTLPLPANTDVEVLLRLSGSIIVSGPQEEALVRSRFGYTGESIEAPPVSYAGPPAAVETLIGKDDYILMHTTIDARSAVLLATIAAERIGLPLVLTGSVASAELMLFLHSYAGDMLRYLPLASLRDDEIEGLYARARVYADIAWTGRGASRFARAGGYGAALVAANPANAPTAWGDKLVYRCDPGSIDSIAAAFQAAWNGAPAGRAAVRSATAACADQSAAMAATARAYHRASSGVAVP